MRLFQVSSFKRQELHQLVTTIKHTTATTIPILILIMWVLVSTEITQLQAKVITTPIITLQKKIINLIWSISNKAQPQASMKLDFQDLKQISSC